MTTPTHSMRWALGLFILVLLFLIAQAVWWVSFMAILVDEKVELALELGASPEVVARIHQEEVSRQVMVGMEGVVFFLVLFAGWLLIYRAYAKQRELKFHQENFLMSVTHELKTPLSTILLYLDGLESATISDEKKRSALPQIRHEAIRLQRLIESALEAGRFTRDQFRLDRREFDISDLVQKRLNHLAVNAAGREVRIERQITRGLSVNGDRQALARALDAILENAIKYTDRACANLAIKLNADGRHVILSIKDDGIGLDRKDRDSVFERFYRAGNELTRQTDGTGLGLYLCREIVRAHDGDVTVQSEGSARGCTFTVRLERAN